MMLLQAAAVLAVGFYGTPPAPIDRHQYIDNRIAHNRTMAQAPPARLTTNRPATFAGQRMPFSAGGAAPAQLPSAPAVLPTLDLIPREDWISVKAMGAKGDGEADDSASVQKALDLVSGCHDKVLMNTTAYFPPGRYKISTGLVLCGITGNFDIGFNVLGHGASCESSLSLSLSLSLSTLRNNDAELAHTEPQIMAHFARGCSGAHVGWRVEWNYAA